MPWVPRMKREANTAEIDAVLSATGDKLIVEVSTRDPWCGARPVVDHLEGSNVLGLWIRLRRQLREHDLSAYSSGLDRAHSRRPPRERLRRS